MGGRRVFVLLIGNKERGEMNHFQLLQEETALMEGRRLGFEIEVAFASGFDQPRRLKQRIMDSASSVDAVVTEPASIATMDLMLRDLRGKTGLIILSAWGPSVEENAASWGPGLPVGTVSTDHRGVGEITGQAGEGALARRGTRPLRQRTDAIVRRTAASGGPEVPADGEDRAPRDCGRPVDRVRWHRGVQRLVPRRQGGRALLEAELLGVDGCPGFGEKLVADGTLAASVVTPTNTGLALEHLSRFWTSGTPVPLRSYTRAVPLPADSI